MDCDAFKRRLDDWLDERLDAGARRSVDRHLESCEACRQRAEVATELRRELRALAALRPSAAARRRMLGHADRRVALSRPWLAAAAAAVFAVGVAAGLYLQQPAGPERAATVSPGTARVAAGTPGAVQLVFQSPQALQDVEVVLELPDGVELVGYPGRRSLAWRTDLAAGRNLMSLPVLALTEGERAVVARLRYGGRERQFQVLLHAQDNAAINSSGT